MHPLALGYLKQIGFTAHRQKDFDVISLFKAVLDQSTNIIEFYWIALSEAGVDLGLPDHYTTMRAVFYEGWERGDPTGELKALFQEVVNGPLNKELEEYM